MAFFSILLIGMGTGAFLSIISMILIGASNSQRYPLGGFLPALLMVNDLGMSSNIIEGGLLVMGGMLGFHLVLTLWLEKPQVLQNLLPDHSEDDHAPAELKPVKTAKIVTGNSLADYL